jgi:hypothetical protein
VSPFSRREGREAKSKIGPNGGGLANETDNKKPTSRRVHKTNPTAIYRGRSHQPLGTSGRLHAHRLFTNFDPFVQAKRPQQTSMIPVSQKHKFAITAMNARIFLDFRA